MVSNIFVFFVVANFQGKADVCYDFILIVISSSLMHYLIGN